MRRRSNFAVGHLAVCQYSHNSQATLDLMFLLLRWHGVLRLHHVVATVNRFRQGRLNYGLSFD